MNGPGLLRQVAVVCGLVALSVSVADAASPEQTFYKAYFLQHETQDFAAAAKLYKEVLDSRRVGDELRAQARTQLAICREELASADLLRLLPQDALAYIELSHPGRRAQEVLRMVGLLAEDGHIPVGRRRVAVSPKLVQELLGLRGLGIAVTGFDPEREMPAGVAVLHPGDIELLRGAIETALPAAAEGEMLAGYPTYFIADGGIYVCLASRLVVVATDKTHIRGVLERLDQPRRDLPLDAKLEKLLPHRRDTLLFACLDARKVMPMLMSAPGVAEDIAPARAMLDLDSLQWLVGRVGVAEHGVYFDLAAALEEGHHNMAYNLIRTPPISADTMKNVPAGAAAFVAAAMNNTRSNYDAGPDAAPAVTGLDIGREIFANVVDFAVFALPPASDQAGPVPDIAAVVRVHDPSRSMTLWNQLLGIASMACGAPSTDGAIHRIGGLEARAYEFEDQFTIYVATLDDKLLMSSTRGALSQAAATAKGGRSILDDEVFAGALEHVGSHTSKAVFVNPGRCLKLARNFMHEHDRKEAEPFIELLGHTVGFVLTNEANDRLHISGSVTGLPNVGPLVTHMIEAEHRGQQMHAQLSAARRHGEWREALNLVETMLQQSQRPDLYRTKFEILALGKEDPQAAREWAEVMMKKIADNATALNNFAWDLLTSGKYDESYSDVALSFAERACENTDYTNWALLDTLALAKFKTNDIDSAIALQEKAVELRGGRDEELVKALERYKEAAHRRGAAGSR